MEPFLLPVRHIDLWFLHALNALSGNWIVDNTMDFISSNNLLKGTLPLAVYWYIWFNRTPNQRRNRVILTKGIVAVFVAVILARGLAHMLPVKLRPFVDPASGFVNFLEPNPRNFENWSAFPSDTAAFTFAIGWSLFYASRRIGVGVVVLSAIPVCLTRIYIGVHYPSDIVVGALIGMLAAWMLHKITIPRLADSAIIQGTGNHPLFYCLVFILIAEVAQVFDNIRAARSFGMKVVHNLNQPGTTTGLMIVCSIVLAFSAIAFVLLRGSSERVDDQTSGSIGCSH